ncbi:MAG: hypothetical protein HY052_05085 [Proteobacteria bacterium]|nr:hypothetical protein [Pseudomonadota bacterium]
MKKYLTLAATLGAIAFISVSYLAQATEQAAAPAAGTAMIAAPAPAAAPAASAATSFKVDSDTCNMLSSAPTTEGSAPTADAQAAAFKKCMMGKGHTEEELKKAEDDAKAAKKDAPAEAAPKADAAPAPAAK